MVDQGVEPWVCLCYGNPIYPGGGDTGLGGGLVASEEALQAWERYVDAFVRRYGEHVDEWELWNEPRTGLGKGAIQYADFVIRTAEVIRKLQPNAEILFAAGGSFHPIFAKEVLEHLKEEGKLDLVNAIIYHPYAENPDSRNDAAVKLREMAQSFAPHIGIRQGENGAPSVTGGFGAISGGTWTETRQAKWALRRLLGDLARDIPSSYFAICEMKYPDKINYKGLLAINDDKTIDHAKQGYYAIQNLASVFDNTLLRIQDLDFDVNTENADRKIELSAYRGPSGGGLITYWRANDKPGEKPDFESMKLQASNLKFEEPILVDLLTGRAYKMPLDTCKPIGQGTMFENLPVYDSPLVVVEQNEIERSLE
ncbi:hypothetical protein Poly41_71000 [Novipirellula artificiosorum]|uniref:Uncharacterized protein n=2 Tax=Novipirellula artificiosorum TaxID=2528016 RepID=A0A5C6CLY2_9BACT|nr:hypothetical protein Poly41_71000 [Novipirellula artificiosorum]